MESGGLRNLQRSWMFYFSLTEGLLRGYSIMRIFKNRWFTRFAAKEGITDEELKAMVNQLEAGQADADLGGDVYKVRVARPGAGKSKGTIRAQDTGLLCFSEAASGRFMYMALRSRLEITSAIKNCGN
jgi:hypothetical protein